jgi:hypothetical protein
VAPLPFPILLRLLYRIIEDKDDIKYVVLQVVHHYLHSAKKGFQTRLRKRMRNGRGTYTFTGLCVHSAGIL